MSVYNINGEVVASYDVYGNPCSAYDIYGNLLTGDYNIASSDYERAVLSARDSWIEEARADETILPIIVHTDQHGRLTANNSLFKYLSKAVPWEDTSACINLGDVCDYSVSGFQNMESCLSSIPKSKQINIWGNHETWTPNWYSNTEVPTVEEMAVLNQYFDNLNYNGNHKYNEYGIEYVIDEERKIKYVVIGGWNYDLQFGGHSHYVIDSETMSYIVEMLSANDEYDIVLLSHIQPFSDQSPTWTIPYTDNNVTSLTAGKVVSSAETTIDQLLIGRKNKTSGTVRDSYGNEHPYDFSECTSDLICCLSGHEHTDAYMLINGIPVVLFDAYAYQNHPFYFMNVDRTKERLNVWRVDDTPQVINYQIPFNKPTTE